MSSLTAANSYSPLLYSSTNRLSRGLVVFLVAVGLLAVIWLGFGQSQNRIAITELQKDLQSQVADISLLLKQSEQNRMNERESTSHEIKGMLVELKEQVHMMLRKQSLNKEEAKSILYPRTCDAEFKAKQVHDFNLLRDFVIKNGFNLGAYSEENLIPTLWAVMPHVEQMVYIDIGANRGQSSSMIIDFWGNPLQHLSEELEGVHGSTIFGEPLQEPVVVAIDMNIENVKLLNTLKEGVPKSMRSNLHIVHAAISDHDGETCFQGDLVAGNQLGSMSDKQVSGCPPERLVKTRTVESLMKQHNLSRVSMVKIDTEGYDAPIVYSLRSLLRAKLIDMVTYEYHGLGVWNQYPLEDVVKFADKLGYDSFFFGDFHLYLLNGACFDPAYSVRDWSNIFMIRKDHPYRDSIVAEYGKRSCIKHPGRAKGWFPKMCDRTNSEFKPPQL